MNYSEKERVLSIAAMHALLALEEQPNGPEIIQQIMRAIGAIEDAVAESDIQADELVVH